MVLEYIEAKILLKNLLKRVVPASDGTKQLVGIITDDEVEALRMALALLDGGNQQTDATRVNVADKNYSSLINNDNISETSTGNKENREPVKVTEIALDESIFSLPVPPSNVRICLDFGTAMSKATLVKNDDGDDYENIEVLLLGVPGEQEQISETMLVSSVYIDDDGCIWFGHKAVDKSLVESTDGKRQRLDNIKRRLSEEGLDSQVEYQFNPTGLKISYSDMVLAYLMFFTWAVNKCTDEIGYPRNLIRRFAMPCFEKNKERETVRRLKDMLGRAQILADTFSSSMQDGIKLSDFIQALKVLNNKNNSYNFISEGITEPLGVAGSLFSWKQDVNNLIMIVDVGAGTSDFSLNRISLNSNLESSVSLEICDSARGITEAGNYLDRILIEIILKKANVNSDHPHAINIRGEIALSIRDWKETLFSEGEVYIALPRYEIEFEIIKSDFLLEPAVIQFGTSLKSTMTEILESIDPSWIEWIRADPRRRLTVALTGGGAALPMVKDLAENDIVVNGLKVKVAAALSFPRWLQENYPELEDDYPRIAVSLGGARKKMIDREGTASITADITTKPTLGGYYTKG